MPEDTKPLVLESLTISRHWDGNYKAHITIKGQNASQTLHLAPHQTVRIVEAATEALAQAAIEQAEQIRNQIVGELQAVIAKTAAATLPPVEDAEVVK